MRTYIDGEVFAQNPNDATSSISMTFASELVQNYAAGKVIDGADHQRLASIQDKDGHPMTFALTQQATLILVHKSQQSNHPTGYEEAKLSDPKIKVSAFGVGQNPDLQFNLCKAEIDPEDPNKVNFYTANSQGPNEYIAHAASDEPNWVFQTSLTIDASKSDRITQIHVANGNRTRSTLPGIVVTSVLDHQANYHILWQGDTPGSGELEELDLAMASMKIDEIIIGKLGHLDGVYSLQSYRTDRVLRFSSFPRSGRQRHVSLKAGPDGPTAHDFTTLQVLPEDAEGKTGLYLGGNGVYHLPASKQGMTIREFEFSLVAAVKHAPGIKNLAVREDQGNVTLWAHTSKDEMINIEGNKPATFSAEVSGNVPSKWEHPIVVDRGIKAWAPIRNRVKQTNDIMVITQRNAFTHKIQDPATKTWTSMTVPLDDKAAMQEFESYTTQLTFRDGKRNALGNHEIEIRSSEWCEATYNGAALEFHPDSSTFLKTDPLGTITLIFQPETVSAPILRVKLDKTATDWEVVDPAQKIHGGIKGLDSAEKLKQAKKQDGSFLLSEADRNNPQKLDSLVKGLSQMQTMAGRLDPKGTVSTNYLADMTPEAIGVPEIWGMEIGPNGINYYEEDAVYQAFNLPLASGEDNPEKNWWLGAILRSAGNILEWLKNAIENVVRVIVEKVGNLWNLAVKIGKLAFRFVVDSLGQIYKAINWVLKKTIGVDLEDIRNWIGFLFDFEAIRQTHGVIANVARQGFPFGLSMIDSVKDRVGEFFGNLKDMAKEFGKFPEATRGQSLYAQRQLMDKQTSPSDKERMKAIQDSPISNFFSQKMQQSGMSGPKSEQFAYINELAQPSSALDKALKEIKKLIEDSVKTFEDMGRALQTFFEGQMTLDNLAKILGARVFEALLNLLHSVMNIIAGVMEEILKKVQALVTEDIELPLLSALYKKFMKTDSMDAIGLILLPLSAAMTTLFKILTGKAPFHEGTGGLDTMKHEQLFLLFKGGADQTNNSALKRWETMCAFTGTLIGGFSHGLTLVFTALESNVPSLASGILNFLDIIVSIPIGKWDRLDVMLNWGGQWCNLLQTAYDMIMPLEPKLSKTIGALVSAMQFVASCVTIIVDLVENAQHPVKLVMSIWEGVNYFIGLAIDLLLAACAYFPYGVKIKEALLLTTGVGIGVEAGSNLAHNILSSIPGVVPDQQSSNSLLLPR